MQINQVMGKQGMLVARIMTRDPLTIGPDASVAEALQVMIDMEFHQMPVLSGEEHLIGIISYQDCLHALGLDSSQPLPALVAPTYEPVRRHMRPAPVVVEPDTLVQEAARLMTMHHLRCLPVMRGESLVGIITVSDLLIAFMQHLHTDDPSDAGK